MAETVELRRHQRSNGDQVLAQIGDDIVEVMNISLAGVRVGRPPSWLPQKNVLFNIIPQSDDGPDFDRAIPIQGHVVGSGEDHLRIAFSAVSYPLAKVIREHAAPGG